MSVWGQVLVALVVPVAWGLVSAWAFDWLRLRRQRRAAVHDASMDNSGKNAPA